MNTIETLTEVFALASGAVDLADKLIEVTKGNGRKFKFRKSSFIKLKCRKRERIETDKKVS